jgi:hypothetical protein
MCIQIRHWTGYIATHADVNRIDVNVGNRRASMKLRPKNWDKFQHYKYRNPPWVRLHRALLDDRDFMNLPMAARALAPLLWLLASESKDGEFDATPVELEFRLRLPLKEIEAGLPSLISRGLFLDASKVLAGCTHDASTMLATCSQGASNMLAQSTETETETETETDPLLTSVAKAKTPQSIGTRLSSDWTPSEAHREQAEALGVNCDNAAEEFRDFWMPLPGAKARKLDWEATFRNRLREIASRKPKFTNHPKSNDRHTNNSKRSGELREIINVPDF